MLHTYAKFERQTPNRRTPLEWMAIACGGGIVALLVLLPLAQVAINGSPTHTANDWQPTLMIRGGR